MSLNKAFGTRFQKLMEERGEVQKDMANLLRVSQGKISSWVNGNSFPKAEDLERLVKHFGKDRVQWLLSLDTIQYSAKKEIEWLEFTPYNLKSSEQEIVDVGLSFAREVWQKNTALTDLRKQDKFKGYTEADIYQAFKSVIRKGYLHIVKVERNTGLELELKQLNDQTHTFPHLRHIHIADIPDVDATILMAECIVHLAMKLVLEDSPNIDSIGVCSGYTMLRLAERIVFRRELLNRISWVPLMGYPKERISVNSANHIALTLASRYGGEPYRMPLVSSEEDEQQEKSVLDKVKAMSLAFVTVNGIENRGQTIDPMELTHELELRSSDWIHRGNTQMFYERLVKERTASQFVGEILGYMLDQNAKQVGSPQFQKFHKENVNAISLNDLRGIVSSGDVWLLAARQYKAEPTYMALRNGLVSGIVIDKTIAKYLIRQLRSKIS